MPERTIKILLFRWVDDEGYDRYARKGDAVNLTAADAKRGDADGAFLTEEDAAEVPAGIGPDSTDAVLSEWVKEAKIPEVLEAAAGNPAFAQRLLLAENDATGNDPRKGVVKGLAAIAGQGDQGTPTEPATYTGDDWGLDELRSELDVRQVAYGEEADEASLAELLVAADAAKSAA